MTDWHRHLKNLFRDLVETYGGVVPAAACLGISHQRISQLQSVDSPTENVPDLLKHILPLEEACGQPVVTGGLSRAITGADAKRNLQDEALDAVEETVAFASKIRAGADRDTIRKAGRKALNELTEAVIAAEAS